MNDELLSVIALIVIVYASYKFYKWQAQLPQRSEDIYYNNVSRSVHTLSAMVDELEQLEQIITDLQTCDSDSLKGVRLSVPSIIGQDNSYTILTDGQDYSGEQLLAIAFSERERKREQIGKAITELYNSGIIPGTPLTEEENQS